MSRGEELNTCKNLPMRRRTGEETRELLLQVGRDMLLERGVTAGVQHIRLQDVLRRAGLTTGAAYRLWDDQTDYQRDLAVSMVRLRVSEPASHAFGAVAEMLAAGVPADDVIRAAADTHVRPLTEHAGGGAHSDFDGDLFLTVLALRAAAHTWPELADASRERHRESVESFSAFYQALMDAYGLRMRSPLTIDDFTEAMAALGEGFAIRSLEGIAHPTYRVRAGDDLPEGDWTLFALGVRALVASFMTADPAGDDAE